MFEFLKRRYKVKLLVTFLLVGVLFVMRNLPGLQQLNFICYGLLMLAALYAVMSVLPVSAVLLVLLHKYSENDLPWLPSSFKVVVWAKLPPLLRFLFEISVYIVGAAIVLFGSVFLLVQVGVIN